MSDEKFNCLDLHLASATLTAEEARAIEEVSAQLAAASLAACAAPAWLREHLELAVAGSSHLASFSLLESEVGNAVRDLERAAGGLAQLETTQTPPPKRRRGRPTEISDQAKDNAARLKAAGGTNREAAMVLYGTRKPSPQQIKSASTIMRVHRRKKEAAAKLVTPTE